MVFFFGGGEQRRSEVITVPGVLEEEGREVPICADLQVALVDMDASVAQQLRLAGEGGRAWLLPFLCLQPQMVPHL